MTHLASLGRRVSGFFTGLGGAGALAVLGDPHSGTVGILTNLLPPLHPQSWSSGLVRPNRPARARALRPRRAGAPSRPLRASGRAPVTPRRTHPAPEDKSGASVIVFPVCLLSLISTTAPP